MSWKVKVLEFVTKYNRFLRLAVLLGVLLALSILSSGNNPTGEVDPDEDAPF